MSIFTDFRLRKFCKKSGCGRPQAVLAISPCVMTRAVLAIPEMECKRVLACASRLPKTHTGVTAYTDGKILKEF